MTPWDQVGEATRGGVPAANKQCTVCHDATYAAGGPAKEHFGGTSKRLRDTINGVTTIADNPEKTCTACHQVAGGPGDDGVVPAESLCGACHVSLVNDHSQVGNNFPRGTGHLPIGGQCRLCHPHERAGSFARE